MAAGRRTRSSSSYDELSLGLGRSLVDDNETDSTPGRPRTGTGCVPPRSNKNASFMAQQKKKREVQARRDKNRRIANETLSSPVMPKQTDDELFAAEQELISSDEDDHQDHKFYVKLLLLGDSGVGKTCIMNRFAQHCFDSYLPTMGVDYKNRIIELKQGLCKCQIWDTAGQPRFRIITRAYYSGAHGIVLVYDVSDRASFARLNTWMDSIREHASESVHGIILCNKVDLENEGMREVTREEGQSFAADTKFKYYETSAKTGLNVELALGNLTQELVDNKVVTEIKAVSGATPMVPTQKKPPGKKKKKGRNMCKQQ